MLIRLQTSCLIVVNTAKIFLSNENCCLFYFCGCLPLQKMLNHLVYNTYHIVENIFLVNDLINILFAVCKLFVWISASWLQRYYLVNDVNKLNDIVCKVLSLLILSRCFTKILPVDDVNNFFAMWFINCKEVVDMFVNNW